MKKQFVVIGLGRFGSSICKELYKLGHDVMAIDSSPERVDPIRNFASHAAVAIGDNLQTSVLCTLLLKEIGVPIVWVKAKDLQHQMILEKVGADRVIQPEREIGIRIAHHMDSEKTIDYIDLSEDYSIIELVASNKLNDQTLMELDIRAKFQCTVLAIKRGETVGIDVGLNQFAVLSDGVESAVQQAKADAGEKDIAVLGTGTRMFEHLEDLEIALEKVRTIETSQQVEVYYKVINPR
ncbi:TrkA family potassium uptake protein [Planococcus sp. ISL-109]|uniref:potassium channel family protein n=1 Tax=Planococcus sp. ISL-109 TaxID=2819166 RepID=UPI001BE808DD|nr:TrkA family potassium uptake protein [Planococcus sp. ISL-109]